MRGHTLWTLFTSVLCAAVAAAAAAAVGGGKKTQTQRKKAADTAAALRPFLCADHSKTEIFMANNYVRA